MEFVIIAGVFVVLVTLVLKFGTRNSTETPPPKRPQPPQPDPGFLQGYMLGTLLNQPGDGQPPHHPQASSPAPHHPSAEIHHTLPDHSPQIDTPSHSHDSGSFDGGSSHHGH